MDASQYKDYVLTLLFIKYVTDRFKGDPDAQIEINVWRIKTIKCNKKLPDYNNVIV